MIILICILASAIWTGEVDTMVAEVCIIMVRSSLTAVDSQVAYASGKQEVLHKLGSTLNH
jgi:hypothetical protein